MLFQGVFPVVCARGVILGMLALASPGAVTAEEGVSPAPVALALSAGQQALTDRMQAFQEKTEAWIFARIGKLDGKLTTEERAFEYDNATHAVKVSRGKVVEKAGWYVNITRKAIPPFVPEPLWSRYIEINVHPQTPHVGMLHATVYLTYLANGKSVLAGYMDYTPGVWHDEDNARLKQSLDAVYAKHGADITRFRRQLCESAFGAKNHRDRLKAACVGASLYDPPFLEVNEQNFKLVTEAFEAFVGTYFDILGERRRQRYTAADIAVRDAMRKRWLEDQLFADTMSMKVVPYEVWSLANQAPAVRF
jgi:coproporphyrinogen III oxidase